MYSKSSSRFLDARGPAEVVERDRGVATLCEAERELLVEAVEPADVREHDDPDPRRLVRVRAERREAVSVTTLEHQVLVGDSRTADHGDRRRRVELEAHAVKILA